MGLGIYTDFLVFYLKFLIDNIWKLSILLMPAHYFFINSIGKEVKPQSIPARRRTHSLLVGLLDAADHLISEDMLWGCPSDDMPHVSSILT